MMVNQNLPLSLVAVLQVLVWCLEGTVEPPNKGHFGSRAFVLFSEVVPWWEVRANMRFIAPQDLIYLDSMY